MKSLFIRFFTLSNNQQPQNIEKLCSENDDCLEQTEAIERCYDDIYNWMRSYPDGKVDFVWLNS